LGLKKPDAVRYTYFIIKIIIYLILKYIVIIKIRNIFSLTASLWRVVFGFISDKYGGYKTT